MLSLKRLILPAVFSISCLCAGDLPDAASIIAQLSEGAKKPEEQRQIDLIRNYREKAAAASDSEERADLWLRTYRAWAIQFSAIDDWSKREELQTDLQSLGRYFPDKADWPALHRSIAELDPDSSSGAMNALRFILALLDDNQSNAVGLLKAQLPEKSPETSNGGQGSILQALMGIQAPRYQSHREPSMLRLALEQASMPELQKLAYEHFIANASSGHARYYGRVPDLTKLYPTEELDTQIGRLLEVMGENFQPYNLPQPMIGAVYSYIRSQDMVPHEDFLVMLDERSPSYPDDVAYFESKRSGMQMSDRGFRTKIQKQLKDGDTDGAWQTWESYTEANPAEAGKFIQLIFGYGSRNYPYTTLNAFALRLLELSDNPELLDIVQTALPLKASEDDVLLVKLRALIAETEDPKKKSAYIQLELDRLLAIGLKAESAEAATAILEAPKTLVQSLLKDEALTALIQYAQAFALLERHDLEDAFIQLAIQSSSELKEYRARYFIEELADYYAQKEDYSTAFRVLQDSLVNHDRGALMRGERDIASILAGMAELYSRSGQHADAIRLLDDAIGWGCSDLSEVSIYSEFEAFKITAAKSLKALGRQDEARVILHDYLRYEDNSADSAYQTLTEIDGADAMEFFKELESEAPFEERPLIWQAVLLKEQGDLEKAEKLARKAISIDPTDGEMNALNRLRAYAVLGDILKARNSEEAQIFKQIVMAVDLSEEADTYRVAGLFSHALAMYEESLELFADAYCVRFRAAVELESAGQHAEAEKHFEAAYTLMPDQFGRIESHCFGCEGAFRGERAERIAERVFSRMLEERPEQASLHYLMGYLNESRERNADAIANFKKAVELDPLYYNAWSHIRGLADETGDGDTALHALEKMLQIAPRRTISSLRNLEIAQLGKLWETGVEILPILPERKKSIYPLNASAKLVMERGINYHRYRYDAIDIQSMGSLLFGNYEVTQLITDSLTEY